MLVYMILKIDDISKQYTETLALNDISLEIKSNEIYCITGPNGSGKSTLIKILATLIKQTSGNILLDGVNINDYINDYKNILGFLPQDVPIYPHLTSFEFLSYISAMKGIKPSESKQQILNLLEIFNLSKYKKIPLGKYSGGMKRRVGIACALLGSPRIIILDEPNAGLDLEERLNLRNFLNRLSKNRIIILATHITSDIEAIASKIAIIQKGELVFNGTPKEFIKNDNISLEKAYIDLLLESQV